MNTPLETIDRKISAKHLLSHPFYPAWTRGELSKAALIDYAQQYYHHVAAFPTYLSAVHAHCEDQPTRKELLKNLVDEEGGSPNHPELWLKFAEGLGVSRNQVQRSEKREETTRLIETFRSVCRDQSTANGLAALYAYESQIPAICESKIDGLKKHYAITDPEHYRYFSVHLEADREHAAAERSMLASHVNADNAEGVYHSVQRVLGVLWDLLSGVCRRHAIECAA